MQVMGTLHQADDPVKGKLKKGSEFPNDALTGDMFTLIDGRDETTYIKYPEGWVRILVEGDNIDAGTY